MADNADVVLERDTIRLLGTGSSPVVDVEGGNHWNLENGDGDVKIGDDENKLKMGVALGGAGAGNAAIWATSHLKLGAGGGETVDISGGGVDIDGDGDVGGKLNVEDSIDCGGNLTMLGEGNDGGNALINRVITKEFSVSQGIISSLIPKTSGTTLGDSSDPWAALHVRSVNKQSDARAKTSVKTLQGGLDAICELRPVSFTWREDDSGSSLGLVAQEVAEVLPEVVSEPADGDGRLGIDYTELVAVLVDAVQTQQAEADELADRLDQQRDRIDRQEDRIESLEARLAALERTA